MVADPLTETVIFVYSKKIELPETLTMVLDKATPGKRLIIARDMVKNSSTRLFKSIVL